MSRPYIHLHQLMQGWVRVAAVIIDALVRRKLCLSAQLLLHHDAQVQQTVCSCYAALSHHS